MSSGNLSPKEVCSITDSLEISPSKTSPGDIVAAKGVTGEINAGFSAGKGSSQGKVGPFKMAPNSKKGPRR